MAAKQDNPPKKRGAGSIILRLLLVGIVGIVVAAGLLIAIPPAGLIKDQIERAASAAAGRTVTISDADVTIWPLPAVKLNTIEVANAAGVNGPPVVRAQSVNARLKLKPLLSGKAEIESLEIIKPEINLAQDANGKGNWSFEPGSAAQAGPSVALLTAAKITDGVLTYAAAGSKEPLRIEKIDGTFEPSGKTDATGVLAHNGETANISLALKDALAVAGGQKSDVKLTVDGKHLKGEVNGVASNAATKELSGDVTMTSGSIGDLARWLGADVSATTANQAGSVTGKFKASASGIVLDGTDIAIGTEKGHFTGTLVLDGARPKYQGSVAVSRIDLNSMLGGTAPGPKSAAPEAEEDLELETAPAWDGLRETLKGLDNSAAPGAAPEAAAASAASAKPAASWSEAPIDLKILQGADFDGVITSDQLVLGKLDLKNAEIRAKLVNGKLDAQLQKLTMGAGSATGKLTIDSSKPVPSAEVALNLVNVAAEPIITEIAGKPLLAGTSNVDITASGEGKSQNDLASSIEGKANFRMSKGFIRGFDVRSIVSNWWNSLTGGLKFDINKKTGFEKLDAQYDIKKGLMTSSPGLDIGGNEVEVQSRGNVSLPAKRINQEIRVKVVPPPSAPPIPVKISGAWSKPNISMDWGDLLFSSRVSEASAGASMARESGSDMAATAAPEAVASDPIAGGFQELAPKPDDIPDDIKAEIKRVLASGAAGSITPEGKALLETLLPAASPEPPPSSETPATP